MLELYNRLMQKPQLDFNIRDNVHIFEDAMVVCALSHQWDDTERIYNDMLATGITQGPSSNIKDIVRELEHARWLPENKSRQ